MTAPIPGAMMPPLYVLTQMTELQRQQCAARIYRIGRYSASDDDVDVLRAELRRAKRRIESLEKSVATRDERAKALRAEVAELRAEARKSRSALRRTERRADRLADVVRDLRSPSSPSSTVRATAERVLASLPAECPVEVEARREAIA